MTTIALTRPPGTRPTRVEATRTALVSHLHAQVKPHGIRVEDDGALTVTYQVVAHPDLVRLACAAVVHEPVTWEVTS